MPMFSESDLQQFADKNISREEIEYQLMKFRNGFLPADIIKPATIGNGIRVFSKEDKDMLKERFDKGTESIELKRFIPASGAASRMFKDLFNAYEELRLMNPPDQAKWVKEHTELQQFFDQLESYPFTDELELTGSESHAEVLEVLLTPGKLNYGNLPKGLLTFHSYPDRNRTAMEEHLREAVSYCRNGDVVPLHLTISPEHQAMFHEKLLEIQTDLEVELGVSFEVSFSFQQSSTDTLAVDLNNEPFRDAQGRLVFRPGGHGALLENLNGMTADQVFISNIDNVAIDQKKPVRVNYKKILSGLLTKLRSESFAYLEALKKPEGSNDTFFIELFHWIQEQLMQPVPNAVQEGSTEYKRNWCMDLLDRPMRVCGMVRNEGQPGGGPFYVRNSHGEVSLQIVEVSQIDTSNPEKKHIMEQSTHFNPVDMVCNFRKADGSNYNLLEFRDPETGFISKKSMQGKALKALELPGLWNGSMAGWITVFVEVPISTFSPVKTVFDLLNPEHQPVSKG